MDVSIIIVNYRSWNALNECLESINKIKTPKIIFEVIIVDNFSDDGQYEDFQKRFTNFIFIKNNNNNGFSNGCNFGKKIAKGNYLLFLNADTIISHEALKVLYETYKNHSEIGILSCLQIDKKNRFFNQNNKFPSFFQIFGITRFFYRFFLKKRNNKINSIQNEIFYPDWVTGALIYISKDWFDKVNGWNEDYWLYFEDVDICKRISQINGKVAVTREATISHEHGGSSRINFETECISKTEVIISKHVYIQNNFLGVNTPLSHFFLIIGMLLEKIILSSFSFIFFYNLKLKTNRFILKNLCSYYYNAIKEQTWLSTRSTNFQKIK